MDDKAKKLARWFCVKMYLQEKHENNNFRNWFTVRGDIYTCHFGENIGDEKCGIGRPVLIVSTDNINRKVVRSFKRFRQYIRPQAVISS